MEICCAYLRAFTVVAQYKLFKRDIIKFQLHNEKHASGQESKSERSWLSEKDLGKTLPIPLLHHGRIMFVFNPIGDEAHLLLALLGLAG